MADPTRRIPWPPDRDSPDALVTRGNQEVVSSVVRNNGARFSDFGFLHMIKRAEGDSILAEQLEVSHCSFIVTASPLRLNRRLTPHTEGRERSERPAPVCC